MSKGLNRVQLIGWLDSNPELRHTPSGRPVVSFSVGTPRTWHTAEGEPHEETEWFNVVAWGGLAEMCSTILSEGLQVYVEGRLQTRSWEDGTGRKHFRTEVVAHDVIPLANSIIEY